MNEPPRKPNRRLRVFSLRSMMILIGLIACIFGLFAYQMHRCQRQDAAIANIRTAGALVYVVDSRGRRMNTTKLFSPTLLSVLNLQPTLVSLVDVSSPSLSTNDIREMIPDLKILLPSCSYELGARYIAIEMGRNPHISDDLVGELQKRLPDFRFVKYTPVPPGTKNAVRIGMTQQELIDTIGNLIYDQQEDWPADKVSTVQMLGSQMNIKYTNANGTETWVYHTDDMGVGVLGIDFDMNWTVADIWTDRGIRKSRNLKKIETVAGGL